MPALACGTAFAVGRFVASNYVSAQPADIGAALLGAGALAAVPHTRRPAAEPVRTAVLTGAGLAFLSPVLGWSGVAVSGSDTSANALFGALQVSAARESGLSPELLAAANSSGGVLGKMISPRNLTTACAAVGLAGRQGDLLRKVPPWSLGLLLVMCLIVVGQSTPVLDWMLP